MTKRNKLLILSACKNCLFFCQCIILQQDISLHLQIVKIETTIDLCEAKWHARKFLQEKINYQDRLTDVTTSYKRYVII